MVNMHPYDDDKLREECAVFGILGSDEAAPLTAIGLHALQHRGQEAAGIVSFDGAQFPTHRDVGLVGEIFGAQWAEDDQGMVLWQSKGPKVRKT